MKRFAAILLTVLAGCGPSPCEEGELAQTYRDLPGFEAAIEGLRVCRTEEPDRPLMQRLDDEYVEAYVKIHDALLAHGWRETNRSDPGEQRISGMFVHPRAGNLSVRILSGGKRQKADGTQIRFYSSPASGAESPGRAARDGAPEAQ